jgi:hypothetical protein
MPARTLIGALALDAIDEFARAVDHVPAPGQRRLGRLNTPAWTVGHLVSSADAWINVFCQRLPPDPWADALYARQRAAPRGAAVETDPAEARDALARFAARAHPYLESADASALARDADVPQQPGGWPVVPAAYLVARMAAHAFAHAGELSVVASLVRAGDLGLPGELAHTRAAAAAGADGPWAPLAAIARDARGEVERAALALPAPARGPTFAPRLSPGANIVEHVALTQDRYWNEHTLDRGEAPASCDFDAAVEDYRRACGRSEDHLAALGAGEAAPSRFDAFGLGWTAAHLYAHAGELATIGSLVGAPDLGLPGDLAHTMAATPRVGS